MSGVGAGLASSISGLICGVPRIHVKANDHGGRRGGEDYAGMIVKALSDSFKRAGERGCACKRKPVSLRATASLDVVDGSSSATSVTVVVEVYTCLTGEAVRAAMLDLATFIASLVSRIGEYFVGEGRKVVVRVSLRAGDNQALPTIVVEYHGGELREMRATVAVSDADATSAVIGKRLPHSLEYRSVALLRRDRNGGGYEVSVFTELGSGYANEYKLADVLSGILAPGSGMVFDEFGIREIRRMLNNLENYVLDVDKRNKKALLDACFPGLETGDDGGEVFINLRFESLDKAYAAFRCALTNMDKAVSVGDMLSGMRSIAKSLLDGTLALLGTRGRISKVLVNT